MARNSQISNVLYLQQLFLVLQYPLIKSDNSFDVQEKCSLSLSLNLDK